MLATRWPLLKLLAAHQSPQAQQGDCRKLFHPSLDWDLWRQQATAFARDVGPWLNGSSAVPESLNAALGAAQGVVWKSSSEAVAQGHSIASWTGRCPLGLLTAYGVRATALVLGQSDVRLEGHRQRLNSLGHV